MKRLLLAAAAAAVLALAACGSPSAPHGPEAPHRPQLDSVALPDSLETGGDGGLGMSGSGG